MNYICINQVGRRAKLGVEEVQGSFLCPVANHLSSFFSSTDFHARNLENLET